MTTKYVEQRSWICTYEWILYKAFPRRRYDHNSFDHSKHCLELETVACTRGVEIGTKSQRNERMLPAHLIDVHWRKFRVKEQGY